VTPLLLFVAFGIAAEEPERVAAARVTHEATLIEKVEALGLAWPPRELHVRMFKDERAVEVWVGDGRAPLELLDTFSECGASGAIGPKVAQGDLQVPEGFYVVTGLNPWSPGLLSLQLDYPNQADHARRAVRALDDATVANVPLGGDIAVHGTCISTGCLAIDDAPIEQLYLLAMEPRRRGRAIRVHVFPTRLEPAKVDALVEQSDDVTVVKLWTSMIPAYRAFERTRKTPLTWARGDGTYGVQAR
jgi:murein L,D-transpeptidase YafK